MAGLSPCLSVSVSPRTSGNEHARLSGRPLAGRSHGGSPSANQLRGPKCVCLHPARSAHPRARARGEPLHAAGWGMREAPGPAAGAGVGFGARPREPGDPGVGASSDRGPGAQAGARRARGAAAAAAGAQARCSPGCSSAPREWFVGGRGWQLPTAAGGGGPGGRPGWGCGGARRSLRAPACADLPPRPKHVRPVPGDPLLVLCRRGWPACRRPDPGEGADPDHRGGPGAGPGRPEGRGPGAQGGESGARRRAQGAGRAGWPMLGLGDPARPVGPPGPETLLLRRLRRRLQFSHFPFLLLLGLF